MQGHQALNWWETDEYGTDLSIPPEFKNSAGPKGVATVKVYPNGATSSGWGLDPKKDERGKIIDPGFMVNYKRNHMSHRITDFQFDKDGKPFAFVMRSMPIVCIDIDGKNGGLEHVSRLGLLPRTLAETSKSGNGYHLFYSLQDTWDEDKGFARLPDAIGIEQGVDFRGTGCVYHHASQQWNMRQLAELPDHLTSMLEARKITRAAAAVKLQTIIQTGDPMDILMEQDKLREALAKPIPAGKRNNTLFAIGQQMKNAGIQEWATLIVDRAKQINLDYEEIDKLIANIQKY